MTAQITKGQIGAIHALKSRAGLDDDAYRDMLEVRTGKRSSTALTKGEAIGVIDHLKSVSSPSQGGVDDNLNRGRAQGALRLDGPYAGVCRALWISAWNLGLIRERSDKALVAFVKRQTGIDHLNWVKDGADARSAIEGLKKWITRESGVEWDRPAVELRSLGISLSRWRKLAVIDAQLVRLMRLNGAGMAPAGYRALSAKELDELATVLGRKIRRALARKAA